jgi:NADH-quinone oxidoreductase E subunit
MTDKTALTGTTAGAGHAHEDYTPVFVGETREKLERLAGNYPTRQALTLPALWMVQEARGWISEAAIAEVAEVLKLTSAQVKGVVTFYTMYHTHPVGRHFIQVCTTSPCNLCGAEDVMKAILRETGCGELGATSADGRFTVIEVECLGACGFATPILINDDFIENVTPERVPGILQRYQ